jgi:hypothetical protein
MTADLKEAFHLAAVHFVSWRAHHDYLRTWSNVVTEEDGSRKYSPEPTVTFFGRDLLLSEICAHARILRGPLSPFVQFFFQCVVDESGDRESWSSLVSYSAAVEVLSDQIQLEKDLQREQPLDQPTLVDRACERVLKRQGGAQ